MNGRLFNYTQDKNGRCSPIIAKAINPVLESIVPHPSKSTRSFRRTFKIMMRNLGVEEEVHDNITGHKIPSASRVNYGGMGVPIMFKAISNLDISFLGIQNLR